MAMNLPDAKAIKGLIKNRYRRTPCILLLDTSYSMNGQKISDLNSGLQQFFAEVKAHPVASQSVDTCIIGFGPVRIIRDFHTSSELPEVPKIEALGTTPLTEALELSMLLVEKRKELYRNTGVQYFRPWIWLLTDGIPTDECGNFSEDYKRLLNPLQLAAQEKKFELFAIGFNLDATGKQILNELSRPWGRKSLNLKPGMFSEMFSWLSASLRNVSTSQPGETIPFKRPDGDDGWAFIDV